ncbi:MAG: GWxTD domain-containing protein [Candidatus Aminicenantes bacterium]|nr:GWxTD domain-containing protein [Candidatus Aminicenantes bacterium]
MTKMNVKNMGANMKTCARILAAVCLLGCAAVAQGNEAGPGPEENFFDQVGLIMTKVEIEIFKHLADDQARDEFIADFWKKRDPTPLSEENEFKEDFSKRVEFANRWFQERGQPGSGWDSERGHVLLMLGFPDQRDQLPMLDNPRAKAAEGWVYYNFALRLEFIDREGFGKFRLDPWPLELLDAIERVKELGNSAGKENYFRFKVACTPSGLLIEIPVKTVVVEERGDDVRSAFALAVDVFCDYVKLERLSLTREFVESRAAFTARKSFVIEVPYTFPKKGKYFLDVVVDELVTGQRFRESARCKGKGRN